MATGLHIAAGALAVACACAGLAPAATMTDRIVPGRSIGAIAVGDERAEIAGRVGDGTVIARSPLPEAPGNRNLDAVTVAYPALGLVVRFGTDEASALALRVSTRSVRYRTAGGVGVGSARGRVLAAHPRALCDGAACRVRSGPGGQRVTRFVGHARVLRVDVLRRP